MRLTSSELHLVQWNNTIIKNMIFIKETTTLSTREKTLPTMVVWRLLFQRVSDPFKTWKKTVILCKYLFDSGCLSSIQEATIPWKAMRARNRPHLRPTVLGKPAENIWKINSVGLCFTILSLFHQDKNTFTALWFGSWTNNLYQNSKIYLHF